MEEITWPDIMHTKDCTPPNRPGNRNSNWDFEVILGISELLSLSEPFFWDGE